WGFEEVTRHHGDFAMVGVCALLACDADGRVRESRVALFGVGPTPTRAPEAERALCGLPPTAENLRRAGEGGAAALDPSDDLQATADYRRHAAAVLAARALAAAATRCAQGGAAR